MKKLAKKIITRIHLRKFVNGVKLKLRWGKRQPSKADCLFIENYFSTHKLRKLHIGCGSNIIRSWLNSDFKPISGKILHLDATKEFPFKDDMFDYIFSEHMIEHISYINAFVMLSECQRVLRNNWKIRITTPNLQFLINLYQGNKSKIQIEYIKWSTNNFIKSVPYPDDTFVINNFVRDWGHLFIYDEKTLRSLLERAGFSKITTCNLNESESESLRNLENIKRMPEGFLQLESFTLEATKSHDS